MRVVQFQGARVKFPSACVCCLRPVHKEYKLERTFVYGRGSFVLQMPVPLCLDHYEQAALQSPAQIWCERFGIFFGTVLGLAAFAGLLWYWLATDQGSLLIDLLLALIVGFCVGLPLWAVFRFWIAPLFAFAETKAVLNSVQMKRFDPARQVLGVAFENETTAELTLRENLSTVIVSGAYSPYHITAHLLDDDIRLSIRIETNVLLDHLPDMEEAGRLLQPVIDRILIQQLGEGTLYEVSDVKVVAKQFPN